VQRNGLGSIAFTPGEQSRTNVITVGELAAISTLGKRSDQVSGHRLALKLPNGRSSWHEDIVDNHGAEVESAGHNRNTRAISGVDRDGEVARRRRHRGSRGGRGGGRDNRDRGGGRGKEGGRGCVGPSDEEGDENNCLRELHR
jgi:hypothetical protein